MNRVSIKLREAMARNNVAPDVIEQVLHSITSFALYGFPESHAISFAILAYGSAYLKLHRAPEFYASLINNQPMGFYTPATIVKDAGRHGLKIQPVCLSQSEWRCTVTSNDSMRLGFCVVNGLRRENADELVRERNARPFLSLDDFRKRVPISKEELRSLANLGALNCFAVHRRDAMWKIEEEMAESLFVAKNEVCHSEQRERSQKQKGVVREDNREIPRCAGDDNSPLPRMTMPERVRADYEEMNLTTGPHPMKLVREQLPDVWRAIDLPQAKHGATLRIAGNVICRQRPGTAKGFVFISLEDETGVSNAIVTPDLFERTRLLITEEPFLAIEGEVQNTDNVVLIKAQKIFPLAHEGLLGSESHDFH
jgi:error-prone DNA polymerase